MKCFILILSVSLAWKLAVSERCQTPLGRVSNCVSLYECPQIRAVFELKPVPPQLVGFLRLSHCGFSGNDPKVCCGPTPKEVAADTQDSRTHTTSRPRYSGSVEPAVEADSYPSPPECGVDTNGDRILGGNNTDLDEFPWMALLGYQPKDSSKPLTYQCGGVILNQRYILSAAHCVVGEIENVVGKLATARLGEYDTRQEIDCLADVCADPVQEIAVHIAFPHPGYSDNNKNRRDDISLIRLAKRAKLNYYVKTICLVGNTRLEFENELFVAGWGKTLSGKSSPVKQKLQLPMFSKSDCVSKYRNLGAEITDKQLCAGGNFAEDACRGDSGGPLMRKSNSGVWETIAVVSFGYGCGRDGWPGIYTSVKSYKDWISETMRSSNV